MKEKSSEQGYFRKLIGSFRYAFRGISLSFGERNMQIHVLIFFFVTIAGLIFDVSMTEWGLIVVCSGMVMAVEILNTAIEEVCNKLRDDLKLSYDSTKDIRDLSAGAVLIVALVSIVVGITIFLPKVWVLVFNLF